MKSLINSRDLAVTQISVTALLFLLLPFFTLLGGSAHKTPAFLHGLAAVTAVILSSRLVHWTFPLLQNKEIPASMEVVLWLTNLLIFLAIVTGNWLYIPYRAPDGPQQWLIFHYPAVHFIVMEFKEFISLFPLPLGITAGVILQRFRHDIGEEPAIRLILTMLLTLSWFCLLAGLIFGLGLMKLKMV